MEEMDRQLQKDLDDARERVEQGIAASNFLKTNEGKLIQDWINERISYLMEKMTANKPISDREYLTYHGGVRELKDFNVMLQSKASGTQQAQEEVNSLNAILNPAPTDTP